MRCTAKSKRSGEQCRKPAIPGLGVCHMHGGNTKAARASAAERLALAAAPAVEELVRLVKRARPDAARVAAINSVLDRSGYGRTSKVDLNVTTLAAAIAELDDAAVKELADALEEE